MGHGFRVNGEKVGWKNDVQGRQAAYALKYWNTLPRQIILIAERLKQVQIENRPAIEIIQRFNHHNVFIYADPPYLLNTRHGKQYRHEMDDNDHIELLQVLLKHKGPVMLSGYPSDLYDDILSGWHKETKISYTQTMTQKVEVLWMNYNPGRQMTLFEGAI
jgi:DNA adenine methylase